jgi:hypothetical protein
MSRRRATGQTIAQKTGKTYGRRNFMGGLNQALNRPTRRGFGGSIAGPQVQQGQVQFSSADGSGVDDGTAKQAISQFSSRLAAAASLLGSFGAVVGSAAIAVKALHGFASILVDSQRGTAKYSGVMSASVAQLDVKRIGREMQTAQATSASFSKLTNSLDKLERSLQPFREFTTNAYNRITSALIEGTVPLVKTASGILPALSTTGSALQDVFYYLRAGTIDAANNLKNADITREQFLEAMRKQQEGTALKDLAALRASHAINHAVNKPNPNIPRQPAKQGAAVGVPAAPVFAPAFMNPGRMGN